MERARAVLDVLRSTLPTARTSDASARFDIKHMGHSGEEAYVRRDIVVEVSNYRDLGVEINSRAVADVPGDPGTKGEHRGAGRRHSTISNDLAIGSRKPQPGIKRIVNNIAIIELAGQCQL